MTSRERFDVVVVGAGPAGIAAALCASRIGAKTLILEREQQIGGNASNAFVHTICGLYFAPAAGEPSRTGLPATARHLHPGFPRRFAEGLLRSGGALPPERSGRVYVLPISPTEFGRYAEDLCTQLASLTVRTDSELTGLAFGSGTAELEHRQSEKTYTVDAGIVVDTTGDATAAALAGADTVTAQPDELQTPSYIVQLSGVETEHLAGFSRLHLTRAVSRAAQHGDLHVEAESVLVRPGLTPGDAYLTLNLPRPPDGAYQPLDAECIRELGHRAQRHTKAVVAYLRDKRPGFAHCEVARWPVRIGVRETRRVAGVSYLTTNDILSGRRRTDEVALSCWPIELWDDHRGARFQHPESAASIPLSALISRTHPHLGAAGRCLSATHGALGALRVIGTALATGEAIGTAAALAADSSISLCDVAPKQVRDEIARTSEMTG